MPRGSVEIQAIRSEADAVAYNAETLADWENSKDPLSVQRALDLLGARRHEVHYTLLDAGAEIAF